MGQIKLSMDQMDMKLNQLSYNNLNTKININNGRKIRGLNLDGHHDLGGHLDSPILVVKLRIIDCDSRTLEK